MNDEVFKITKIELQRIEQEKKIILTAQNPLADDEIEALRERSKKTNKKLDEMLVIDDIFDKYTSGQWYNKILEAIPGIDKGYLLSIIEIKNGGDVRVIDEDGNESGYFKNG